MKSDSLFPRFKSFFGAIIISLVLCNSIGLIFLLMKLDRVVNVIQVIQDTLEIQSQKISILSNQNNAFKKKLDDLDKKFTKEISFLQAVKFTLSFEGGISDDAGDLGGLTNLGITHNEYDHYRAAHLLPFQSVKSITKKEAVAIYRHTYWLDSGCSKMPSRIAISCFDNQVNTGRGIVALQSVLGITADGIAGHETFNELNSWLQKPKNEEKLLCNYFKDRDDHYRAWGVGSQAKFLRGWLRRSRDLKEKLDVA